MPAPRFDPTVTLGSIITAVTILVTVVGAWFNVSTRVNQLEQQGSDREARLRTLELTVAAQVSSLGNMRETLGEIKADLRRLIEGTPQ